MRTLHVTSPLWTRGRRRFANCTPPYLIGSYRIATASESNSNRLTA